MQSYLVYCIFILPTWLVPVQSEVRKVYPLPSSFFFNKTGHGVETENFIICNSTIYGLILGCRDSVNTYCKIHLTSCFSQFHFFVCRKRKPAKPSSVNILQSWWRHSLPQPQHRTCGYPPSQFYLLKSTYLQYDGSNTVCSEFPSTYLLLLIFCTGVLSKTLTLKYSVMVAKPFNIPTHLLSDRSVQNFDFVTLTCILPSFTY